MYRDIVYNFYDEEEYKEIIKNIIKLFRGSREYDIWRNSYNRDICVATNLSKTFDGVEIELHHYGQTLWDWVEFIIDSFVERGLPLNTFYICLILIDIHITHCIPCVPLSHDVHKMIHSDYVSTIEKYPSILENIYQGNIPKLHEIVEYHINNLIKLLEEEEKNVKK